MPWPISRQPTGTTLLNAHSCVCVGLQLDVFDFAHDVELWLGHRRDAGAGGRFGGSIKEGNHHACRALATDTRAVAHARILEVVAPGQRLCSAPGPRRRRDRVVFSGHHQCGNATADGLVLRRCRLARSPFPANGEAELRRFIEVTGKLRVFGNGGVVVLLIGKGLLFVALHRVLHARAHGAFPEQPGHR